MIHYLIVDDEPLAHSVVENYCAQFSQLQKVGNCYNARQALDCLYSKAVDLIFLDINMPEVSGFELIRGLKHRPKIIVTSAHQEFAIEGYELDVADYLLKPFSFTRFMKAIEKVSGDKNLNQNSNVTPGEPPSNVEKILFLKEKGGNTVYRIPEDEIVFLEAAGNYCKVICDQQTITTPRILSDLEKEISKDLFVRTHRSFIVSRNKIDAIEGNMIKIGMHQIPIGKNYKIRFNEALNIS